MHYAGCSRGLRSRIRQEHYGDGRRGFQDPVVGFWFERWGGDQWERSSDWGGSNRRRQLQRNQWPRRSYHSKHIGTQRGGSERVWHHRRRWHTHGCHHGQIPSSERSVRQHRQVWPAARAPPAFPCLSVWLWRTTRSIRMWLSSVIHVPIVRTGGGDISIQAIDSSSIDVITFAAAVSVAVGNTGVGVTGGASAAANIILTRTNAFIENSEIGSASNHSGRCRHRCLEHIDYQCGRRREWRSASASGLSSTGVGVGVGVAVARNFIGWDPYGVSVSGTVIDVDGVPRSQIERGDEDPCA
jgi:hypothetical protein